MLEWKLTDSEKRGARYRDMAENLHSWSISIQK